MLPKISLQKLPASNCTHVSASSLTTLVHSLPHACDCTGICAGIARFQFPSCKILEMCPWGECDHYEAFVVKSTVCNLSQKMIAELANYPHLLYSCVYTALVLISFIFATQYKIFYPVKSFKLQRF